MKYFILAIPDRPAKRVARLRDEVLALSPLGSEWHEVPDMEVISLPPGPDWTKRAQEET